MDNSILIGQYTTAALRKNDELMKVLPSNSIFALRAHPETKYPYVVYSRNSIMPKYTKDGLGVNDVQMTFNIVSDTYISSLEIANLVRSTLELYYYRDNNIRISPMQLISATENTVDDAFVQTLIFTTTTQ